MQKVLSEVQCYIYIYKNGKANQCNAMQKQCKRCSAVWFLLQLYAGSEYAGGQTWPGALTNLGKSSQYVTSIAHVLEGSDKNINNNNYTTVNFWQTGSFQYVTFIAWTVDTCSHNM